MSFTNTVLNLNYSLKHKLALGYSTHEVLDLYLVEYGARHLLEQAQCTVGGESSLCLVLQHGRGQVGVVAGVHPECRQTLVVPLVLSCHPWEHRGGTRNLFVIHLCIILRCSGYSALWYFGCNAEKEKTLKKMCNE